MVDVALDLAERKLKGDLGVDPSPLDGVVGARSFLMAADPARYRGGRNHGER